MPHDRPTHYVLVNPAGVYTKDAAFFESQGGLRDTWGKAWEPVTASSLYEARKHGIKLRRERFPFSRPTLGERGERPEDYWPEANSA